MKLTCFGSKLILEQGVEKPIQPIDFVGLIAVKTNGTLGSGKPTSLASIDIVDL